jgi:hypothetical protein
MDLDDLAELLRAHLMWADSNLEIGIKLLDTNPFNGAGVFSDDVTSLINSIALTLVTLFFMVDFCNRAMLIKLKTPEEIFKVVFKLFVAKAFVSSASDIMSAIYSAFTTLATKMSSASYSVSVVPGVEHAVLSGYTNKQILDMFLTAEEYADLENNSGIFGIRIIIKYLSCLFPMLVVWIATLIVTIVLVGRLLEVIIYTAVAPIPLSTLAGEGTHDIAKNFIKNYCAVCIQAFVLIAIFSAFGTITTALTTAGSSGMVLITLASLSLAVASAKSGSIAKTICGC